MKFGPVPPEQAAGAVLAYSLDVADRHLKKGRVLTAGDVADLVAAGFKSVTVARLAENDLAENSAATMLARALVPSDGAGLDCGAAFAGRVNITAKTAGLVGVDSGAVGTFNSIDPAITVATLPDLKRVAAGALVATVKVIPYAVESAAVDKVCNTVHGALCLHPFRLKTAGLVLSTVPDMKPSLLEKAQKVVAQRLQGLGVSLEDVKIVPHEETAIAAALGGLRADMVLLLTGSATSDENDVGPRALRVAGGRMERFGMPVDPGNLLFLGELHNRPMVGLPGCARSPALNGADVVLERLACGLAMTNADIAALGVGGLLKEIPSRPQPRRARPVTDKHPKIVVLMLAAGAARRMRGRDKLLEDVYGQPMLRHAAKTALASRADSLRVVLPPDAVTRADALAGLVLETTIAPDWAEGMAASVRAGMAALSPDCDAVILAFGDMPDLTPADYNALIAGFDPAAGQEICRAVTQSGRAGHPVLFSRRFFESLAALTGDRGARDIVQAAPEYVHNVTTSGEAAVRDLDTPEDWGDWRRSGKN